MGLISSEMSSLASPNYLMFCLFNQIHVQLVLVTMNLSVWPFFLCWITFVTRLKQFFLVQQHIPNNTFQLVLAWDLSFSISKHIINNSNSVASLFNSTSSFNDPMLQSLIGQSDSTCHKNDGPWKQQLLDVSFLGSSPHEASSVGFSLFDTCFQWSLLVFSLIWWIRLATNTLNCLELLLMHTKTSWLSVQNFCF